MEGLRWMLRFIEAMGPGTPEPRNLGTPEPSD